MPDPSAPLLTADDDALRSYVYGQALDFFLTLVPVFSLPFGNDFNRTLVFFAAARGSVGHLNHHNRVQSAAAGGVFPDELRRPVSVLSISGYLNLPYETTRRHMHALVAEGWCERVGTSGFLVRGAKMRELAMSGMATISSTVMSAYVRRLVPVFDRLEQEQIGPAEPLPEDHESAATSAPHTQT